MTDAQKRRRFLSDVLGIELPEESSSMVHVGRRDQHAETYQPEAGGSSGFDGSFSSRHMPS